MKFANKFRNAVLIICVITAVCITGCGNGSDFRKIVFTTGFGNDEVFRIEDSVCSLQEILVYLINTQKGYENSFGTEIWSAETDDGTVEAQLKESVLAKVAQIKAMNLLAVEENIELTDSETSLAREAATEYYESLSQADIDAMGGATLDTIYRIYTEYATADKLYAYIIRDINPEISDDEARTITVEQILIKTYSLDASGERVSFNDSEKSAALAKAKSIRSQLIEGASFEELMSLYNEADESTISFGKGEKEESFENAAFSLGLDEVSSVIETSDGYVIIKCISSFNREETESNKVRIVEERKKAAFGEKYDAFVDTLTKELNEKLWEQITVSTDENVTSSDIWEVYRKYFG